MSNKHNDDVEIDIDAIEEIREVLDYAVENRSWIEVEEALELLCEILGYEQGDDIDEEDAGRRNHLEE